jgi:aryl-alcohol dehydrogenase-like predicted oxidoreductase
MDEAHNVPPAQANHKVQLGTSGLHVSPLGVGTNAWRFNQQAMPGLQSTFEAALNAGVDFFDTAEVYGFGGSERTLGQFLATASQKPVVATKFLPVPWRLGKSSLTTALRGSLSRLGVAQVDLYLIHSPVSPVAIETWMDALADAVQAGLTRGVGVSNYSAEQMRRAHAALSKRGIALACNQVEYSLLQRSAERNGLLSLCRELGVTLVAYHPIASGLLTGKYTPDNPPRDWRRLVYRRAYLARIQPVVDHLRQIGAAHGGKTPSQVALNWIICKGALPIPGAKNVRQAQDNAGALGWRLTDDEVAALDAASP